MAKKRTWYAVHWTTARDMVSYNYLTLDATLDAAIARIRSVMNDRPDFMPGDSISHIGHQRGLSATEKEIPERWSVASDCLNPENVLETIPLTSEMVGFVDLRKETVDFAAVLKPPVRVWVGQIDIKSSVVANDFGVLVIPHDLLTDMVRNGKADTQADMFRTLVDEYPRLLPSCPSLRNDCLHPAILVKQSGFEDRSKDKDAQIISFRSSIGWGSTHNDVVKELSKTMILDDSRDVLVIRTGDTQEPA